MEDVGEKLGLPETNRRKNTKVYQAGLASLEVARSNGVTMAFGTDLIGETQVRQHRELAIRHQVETCRRRVAVHVANNGRALSTTGQDRRADARRIR